MKLRYAIIGSGAIGGYYGAMLTRSGKDVHFLFHSDYDHVTQHGLQIDSIRGNFEVNPVQAYNSTTDMPKADVVLVGLKTTSNKLLQELLPPIVHNNTLVILIQNGLGMEADLAKVFPDLNIAGAITFICSAKVAKGRINHMDQGSISLGAYKCYDNELLAQVCADFNQSGVECQTVELQQARWKKLLWNIPFNGLSVVLDATTSQLVTYKHTRKLIYDMAQEVIQAANAASGGKFTFTTQMADHVLTYTDAMKPYHPSMKLDYDHQRPLEIEYIYEKPIQSALQFGYEMKLTQMLASQLHYMQEDYLRDKY